MATWHQAHSPQFIEALWAPVPGKWKCISDKYGEPASCMTFHDEAAAVTYCEATGDILIPPPLMIQTGSMT